MRQLNDHIIPGTDNNLTVAAIDEPGAGGANHHYQILTEEGLGHFDLKGEVAFQNGPILEAGVNGVTEDALITILLDRFRSFQKGPYASRTNAVVITKLEEALMWNQRRTHDRLRRGVEGTSKK